MRFRTAGVSAEMTSTAPTTATANPRRRTRRCAVARRRSVTSRYVMPQMSPRLMITTAMGRLPRTAAVLALLAACGGTPSPRCAGLAPRVVATSRQGFAVLRVEVARTTGDQQRGLSGRASLGASDGMAFVFDHPVTDAFWMKDTSIPLTIALWNRSGRIVQTFDMAPCGAGPCRRYRPARSYVGAVEANRGYFARHGVGVGDRVRLVGRSCR